MGPDTEQYRPDETCNGTAFNGQKSVDSKGITSMISQFDWAYIRNTHMYEQPSDFD